MKLGQTLGLLMAALALALPGWAGAAEPSPASDAPRLEAFNVLLERNIFDPQRRPNERGGEKSREETAATTSTTERISLDGVMIDGGRAVAFFEGTETQYTVAVRLGEEIAGHRLVEIHTDQVRLEKKGRTLELPVAGQLSRAEKGDWVVAKEVIPILGDSSTTSDSTSTDEEKSPSDGEDGPGKKAKGGRKARGAKDGDSQNDMVKKLMERRRKELGQ